MFTAILSRMQSFFLCNHIVVHNTLSFFLLPPSLPPYILINKQVRVQTASIIRNLTGAKERDRAPTLAHNLQFCIAWQAKSRVPCCCACRQIHLFSSLDFFQHMCIWWHVVALAWCLIPWASPSNPQTTAPSRRRPRQARAEMCLSG